MTKVLVVDDIFTNRLLLGEIMEELGCECIHAENGREAIRILEKQPVDIILMDIEMPIMNGLETTRSIRKNFNKMGETIPIIALTAHNPSMFFEDFEDVGFNELLTKPYSIEKVSGIIQSFSPRE
jgi:CheY-like chemotaxis protein